MYNLYTWRGIKELGLSGSHSRWVRLGRGKRGEEKGKRSEGEETGREGQEEEKGRQKGKGKGGESAWGAIARISLRNEAGLGLKFDRER